MSGFGFFFESHFQAEVPIKQRAIELAQGVHIRGNISACKGYVKELCVIDAADLTFMICARVKELIPDLLVQSDFVLEEPLSSHCVFLNKALFTVPCTNMLIVSQLCTKKLSWLQNFLFWSLIDVFYTLELLQLLL